MNLLARARYSSHLLFPSPPRKCLFFTQPITALQHTILYSTRTAYIAQKTQQTSKPRTQKPSESSSSFSQRVKKQTEALTTTVWPKPREIPYQAKVANFVNMIGYVTHPVQFESDSDGKHWATTVISQENVGGKNSLLIPVVFEGDLAHVVSCHVKENDCVFVSGQLSVGPMQLVVSESFGKFHVVAENLNFVEGLKRNVSDYVTTKHGFLSPAVEMDVPVKSMAKSSEEVKIYPDGGNNETANQSWREALEHVKTKSSDPVENYVKPPLNKAFKSAETLQKADELKPDKGHSKNKDDDSWRDLVINPLQWWDYREHKLNGLVKPKFPDFKHKANSVSLWVNTAPDWVLAGIGKLEFDVKVMKPQVQLGEGVKQEGKGFGDPWKNLVENPDKWWDNRPTKRNPKYPDFKHKETGEVLWLDKSPDWATSRLPPLKECPN